MRLTEYTRRYEELFHKHMEELRQLKREYAAAYSSQESEAHDCEKEEAGRLFSSINAT
jgi:hypothetical protein